MGFVNQPNYSGIGPNTAVMNRPQPMQQQPQTNATQYNLNRACNMINNVISRKVQTGELNQMAANQCAANLRAMFNNGSLTNKMYQHFGTNMANDSQLDSFVDYVASEWASQASLSGMNIRGTPQPMYGQQMMGQPMFNQPMFGQSMHQVPMNPFGQPVYGQPMMPQPMYGQPMMQQPMYSQPMMQQPMYTQPMRPMPQAPAGIPSVDSVYGNSINTTNSSYYNSTPMTNVTGNQVHTQLPQVSTYRAPQTQAVQTPQVQAPQVSQAPQVQQPAYQQAPVRQPAQQYVQQPRPQVVPRPQQPAMQCISTPTPENPRGFNPYGNNTVQAATQSVKELTAQIDPVLIKPSVVDLTVEEEAKLYPDDEFGLRDKQMRFIKLMVLEYHKHIYGSDNQKTTVAAKTDAQIIEMKNESAPSNTAVIKRVLAANKGHDSNKQFMYKIGYKKEVVIDMPFSLAHIQHDNMQQVWSKHIDPEDNTSIYKVLEVHQFEVAKELTKKFKTTHPDYQKAMEPIILSMYNNIMDTASIIKTDQGRKRMERATSIDDIYDACCLSDMSRYGLFKQLPKYCEVLANALRSSLFAIYNPFDKSNYLNYRNPRDRAVALANPEIGVFVNYVTDRYLPSVKTKDNKPLDEKKIASMVDAELQKHFVIKVDKCVVYTNMEMPFAKKPTSVSFAPGVIDAGAGGDTNIFLLHTLIGTLDTSYTTSNVCIPEIVLANDTTTKKLPYVIVNTMDDYALGCRVVAAA